VSRRGKVGVAAGQKNNRIGRIIGVAGQGSLRPHEELVKLLIDQT
jgi:hypothetical protein